MRTAKPADKYVLWIVLVLAAAGIVAVYSAISFLAETKAGGDAERFLLRHVFRLALALGAIALFSIIDYHTLVRWSRLALIVSSIRGFRFCCSASGDSQWERLAMS